MESPYDNPAEEIKRLQRCINDLVSILALPAIWTGGESFQIVSTLLDALMGLLNLDFAYVRLNDPLSEAPFEMARGAVSLSPEARPKEAGQLIKSWLGDDPKKWPPVVRKCIGGAEISIASWRMGLHGETGVIVVGSYRADFPRQTESLVLSVAANQAAIGLQEARLLRDQKRIADELDQQVAQRAKELAEVENNFSQIVDRIPGLVCTMSPTGEIELLNRPLLEYFGKTPQELRGWAFNDAVHPDDLPRVIAAFTHSITTETPYDIEHRCRRADGIYRWFQVRALPVRNKEGSTTGWYVLLSDIDDRKRAEEALQLGERTLSSIINTIPTTAWSTRPDGYCEFLNQRWLDYAGLTADQARGWGWGAAIHPDDVNRLVE